MSFATLEGPKWLKTGSKWAHLTGLCAPNGQGSFLKNALLTHFLTHSFEGTNGLFDTRKTSRTWIVPTVSNRLAVLEQFLGLCWVKNGYFWPKTAQIWEGNPQFGAYALGHNR